LCRSNRAKCTIFADNISRAAVSIMFRMPEEV
jgi:hypothetical protein